MIGWFSVTRSIFDHPIFHKRSDRLYVWLWMLRTAAWRDTTQNANSRSVAIKRGQLLTSYRQIEQSTGVSVKIIRGLIDRLKTEHAIGTDTDTGRLLITIRNYEKYQAADGGQGTGRDRPKAQQRHTKETKEQGDNNPPSEGASAADPVKVMFDSGIALLMAAGKSEAQARSLPGKWRRDYGTEVVIVALAQAQREGAIDPVEYVEGIFRFQRKNQPKWSEGSFRALSPSKVQEFMHGKWEHRGDLTEVEISQHPKFIGRAPAYREMADAV